MLTPFPDYDPRRASESRAALAATYAPIGRPMALITTPGRSAAAQALAALSVAMPNFGGVVDRIADHLALAGRTSATPVLRLPPLLLVGPPGIGKTRFLNRLGQGLCLPVSLTGLGGSADNREISGTARGWGSAYPAWPVIQLVKHRIANPLLVLDEVDKAGGGAINGRVHDSLLALLEPGTAARYEDSCLGGPIDLSAINWMATANDPSGLPAPLRSRLMVITVAAPAADQARHLIANMLHDVAAGLGVADPRLLPTLPEPVVEELARDYGRHLDPRRLRCGTAHALARAARHEEQRLDDGTCGAGRSQ